MKVEVVSVNRIQIELVLNLEEARHLMGMLQNPICSDPLKESPIDSNLRETIFTGLEKVGILLG